MRLLWKILLLSTLVAVVPLTVAGWNIISRVRDAFIYSTENAKLEALVSDLINHLDEKHLRSWREFLESVDRIDPESLASGDTTGSSVSLAALLETQTDIAVLRIYPNLTGGRPRVIYNWTFAESRIADPDDRVFAGLKLAETDAAEARAAAGSGRLYVGKPFRVPGIPDNFVIFAIPRVAGGRRNGAIVATMSLREIQRDIEETQGNGGVVYIIDHRGLAVAHPDTSVLARAGAVSRSKLARTVLATLTDRASHGDSDVHSAFERASAFGSTAISGEHGVGYAYAVCKQAPWAVVALKPLGNSLAPAFQVIREVVLWLALGLAIAIVGALLLSRTISRPVKLLGDGARAVGEGNFAHRIELDSHDEFNELADAFNRMAGRLQAYDALNVVRIVREKMKTDAIIHNIADGVIVTGANDEVLVINGPAERWFVITEKDALGRSIDACVATDGFADLVYKTRTAPNGVEARDFVIEMAGQVRRMVLHAHAARVETAPGEFIGVIIVLRDVTTEREVDRMKTEIVSVVAHELRSPLVSIMGFSGLLREENLDPATRTEFARIINDESNRMVEMINKYLDISRIESGRTEIARAPTNIVDLVRQVVEINRGQAEAKTIVVEIVAPQRVTPIMIDPNLIGQAVLNLFTNAIKYSPSGTAVTVRIVEHREDMEIAVADQGFGISEEAKTRLFERFFRAEEDPRVRQTSGTGLGLSLVREIVEHHGGRVSVESELDKGSTFAISLPKHWG